MTNFRCHKLTAKLNKRKNSDMKNSFAINMGKLTILNAENIKICGWITKLEAIKCNLFALSSISAEYLQKI